MDTLFHWAVDFQMKIFPLCNKLMKKVLKFAFIFIFFSSDEVEQENNEEGTSEAQEAINGFWPKIMDEMKKIKHVEPGNQILPLARIKKIMKLDEDVKMISAEAPLLFAKACEIFIHELTMRAWLHTDDNKRRTLQRNDIAMAISKYDQFDFLIDIVPRDEIKPKKEETVHNQQQQQQQKPTTSQQVSGIIDASQSFQVVGYDSAGNITQATIQQPAPAATPTVIPAAASNAIHPMIIPIQTAQGAIGINQLGQLVANQAQQQQAQQAQLQNAMQQIHCILPSGEIAQIPVSFFYSS